MALPSIEVKVTADTSKAQSGLAGVERSIDDVTAAQKRANTSNAAFERGMSRAGRGAGNLSYQVRNASFQVADFAVQVQSGQAVSIALAQQLPQLIGSFGTLGAVLSAVIPIGIAVGLGMKAMADSGRDVTRVLGTLEPLAQGISTAMGRIGEILIDVAELVINNLDRIITIAATAAAFFAGRWVAAFIAARVATFSLSTALVALRGALIRTGFGALIVAAGELVFQFTRLVQAAGSFGEAMSLLAAVGAEVWQRLKDITGAGIDYMIGKFQLMSSAFINQLAQMGAAASDFFFNMGQGMANIPGMGGASAGMLDLAANVGSAAGGLSSTAMDLFKRGNANVASGSQDFGPLKSIQKIRDLLASMKEENLSLDGILFGGDGEEDDGGGSSKDKAAKKLDEKLTAQEERIKSFFDRIKALTVGGLSDKLGAWGDYFSGLVALTGTQNEKLLRVAKTAKAGQALVDAWAAYNQVLADPSFIGRPWARVAAAGQVLAAGLGAVSAIKGVSSGGGSAGSSGSSSASSSSSSSSSSSGGSSPLMVGWNATNPNDLITVGMAQKMFEMISDEAGDRGFTIMRTA